MTLPDLIPGALHEVDRGYNRDLDRLDGIVFHLAVSEATRPSYAPGTKAHGYIRRDGVVVQDVSLRKRCGASGYGNPRLWAFETQGGIGKDANEGEWTDAQLATMARLCRIAFLYGVPQRLMRSSASTERGVGWHRLGIDGNFPASGIQAGRLQRGGGELWSSSRGKECPGNARVAQMPDVLALAAGGDDPMAALDKDDVQAIALAVLTSSFSFDQGGTKRTIQLHEGIAAVYFYGDLIASQTNDIPGQVWRHPLEHPIAGADGKHATIQAGTFLRYEPAEHENTRKVLATALAAGLAKVDASDPEAIAAVVREALDGFVGELESTTTVRFRDDAEGGA